MKCGHVANATTKVNGVEIHCCVICAPNKNAYEINTDIPDLTGRRAKCSYCEKSTTSSFDLPFFEHKPDSEFDEYYDGCFGWD